MPSSTTPNTIRILALSGSLRRESHNRRLLESAAMLAPPGMSLALHDTLSDIPLFDEDLEAVSDGGPEGVIRLREAIAAADGVLIATPEYNQSLPGVLKNAIDWLSRPDASGREVLEATPVAIIGATTGPWGTRLAQAQLRQALAALGARTLPAPMLFVRDASRVFDVVAGRHDDATQEKLRSVLVAFEAWIRMMRA